MKKLLLTVACSSLMFSSLMLADTVEQAAPVEIQAETAQAATPATTVITEAAPVAPATSTPVVATPKKAKTNASKILTAQLKEAAKAGDITKLQTILNDAKNEQKIIKNCSRCKEVTKTIIYKTLCNAVKSGKIDFAKELLAKEAIVNAFNTKVSATTFDAIKADRLEKLIVKNNKLDFAELLIEKTTYRVRLAGLLTANDAKLKITQDMTNLLQKHNPSIHPVTLQATNTPATSAAETAKTEAPVQA